VELDDVAVRRLRQRAQLLHRPGRLSALGVVRRLVGIQAQDRATFRLAIRARSASPIAADVDRALWSRRSIVRSWLMRGTLHLVASEDYPWIRLLTAEPVRNYPRLRLRQEGVRDADVERGLRAIRRMLANDGPLTRQEIADRLARRGIHTEGQAAPWFLALASIQGIVCQGPDRGARSTFVLVDDWLGRPQRPVDRDAALAEFARRYLLSHAPAAPDDFQAWSGLGLRDARRAWSAIAGSLTEARWRDRTLWMPRRTNRRAPRGPVRLASSFEEYLLGWKGREATLPPEHAAVVVPGGGLLKPCLIVDGLVAGAWRIERRRDGITVEARPFAGAGPSLRRALHAEASDVGRFLGAPAELRLA